MASVTQALVLEHTVFRTVFDQVERLLPMTESVPEVQRLSGLVEGLLRQHGETEKDLAYSALDHVLEENGRLNRLHQDHREIDEHFKRIRRADELIQARQLLTQALAATREHFRREETIVFPFLDRMLQPETSEALGGLWPATNPASHTALPSNPVTS